MCDPVTMGTISVLSAGLGTAKSLASQKAAHKRDQAMADANIQRTKNEAATRSRDASHTYIQEGIAQNQANQEAAEEQGKIAREGMKARALARVSAGESGVTGASVNRAGAVIGVGTQMDAGAVEMNRRNAIQQGEHNKEAARLRAKTQPAITYVGGEPNVGLTIMGGVLDAGAGIAGANRKYGNPEANVMSPTASTSGTNRFRQGLRTFGTSVRSGFRNTFTRR